MWTSSISTALVRFARLSVSYKYLASDLLESCVSFSLEALAVVKLGSDCDLTVRSVEYEKQCLSKFSRP